MKEEEGEGGKGERGGTKIDFFYYCLQTVAKRCQGTYQNWLRFY